MNNNGFNNNNCNTILITVIGIATLLVALVGATFAYFSANAVNDNKQSNNLSASNGVAITYKETGNLELLNAMPGSENKIKITVTNPEKTGKNNNTINNSTFKYNLVLYHDKDEFATNNEFKELTMNIVQTNSKSVNKLDSGVWTEFDLTDGAKFNGNTTTILSNQEIAPGETQTYEITLKYQETNNQSTNNSKSYSGHIMIENIENTNIIIED